MTVTGNAGNNGSPLNLNVSYTLGDGFGALGIMGFLEALLTEKAWAEPYRIDRHH